MKKIYLFLLVVGFIAAGKIYSQQQPNTAASKIFRGTVGELRIQMTLTRAGNKLNGTYFYAKIGKDLKLTGTIDAQGNFRLDELDAGSGAKTGEFKGAWKSDGTGVTLTGEWINPKNKKNLAFLAEEQMIFLSGSTKLFSKSINEEDKEKRFEINAEYPELNGFKDAAIAAKFNQLVREVVMREVNDFKKLMDEMTDEEIEQSREAEIKKYLEMWYRVNFANDKIISIGWGNSTFAGGAHPNYFSASINFDLRTGKKIELAELFKPNSNYLKLISDYCIRSLKTQTGEMSDEEWIQNGAGMNEDNFKSWNLTKDGILINFDPYQVAAYAAGAFEVWIPFRDLKNILRQDAPVTGL